MQWTVTLRTSNERATVMLDKAGNVVGSDLSDTVRGREIDLLVRDDWLMAEAQRLIARAVEGARVHELTVYKDGISVTADHPTDASLQRGYNWSLEGVRRDPFDVPNLVKLGLGDKVSFDFGEIDLTSLPAIKAAAREAYGSASATMTEITASKPTHTASALLQVMWEAGFREANGETGSVWLTRDGAVLEVDLPPSRRPVAGPWLAPETIADTLARITETFGADARLYSITIDDELARLDIEDPRAPGQLAQFLVYPDKIERWGSPSFFADLAPDHVFTMADLAPLTAETIAALSARTLERLTGDGFAIFRYTISRQALLLDPRNTRLMVEIRAGLDNGIGTSGWVTFTLDGEIADELQP